MSCKIPEFFEKSPLSEAEKHPDFQVTSCHHFDTTNVDFTYIESEEMLIFCENTDIFDNFWCDIGLSIRRERSVSII
jgi:hypothetical protein